MEIIFKDVLNLEQIKNKELKNKFLENKNKCWKYIKEVKSNGELYFQFCVEEKNHKGKCIGYVLI